MGRIIKATISGVEQDFEMLGAQRGLGETHFVSVEGNIAEIQPQWALHKDLDVLRLIAKRYTFGGVVYEETGERRLPVEGDWFTNGYWPFYATLANLGNVHQTILRPVAIEEQS